MRTGILDPLQRFAHLAVVQRRHGPIPTSGMDSAQRSRDRLGGIVSAKVLRHGPCEYLPQMREHLPCGLRLLDRETPYERHDVRAGHIGYFQMSDHRIDISPEMVLPPPPSSSTAPDLLRRGPFVDLSDKQLADGGRVLSARVSASGDFVLGGPGAPAGFLLRDRRVGTQPDVGHLTVDFDLQHPRLGPALGLGVPHPQPQFVHHGIAVIAGLQAARAGLIP